MYNAGIDLGGTNIAVGVVDERNNLILKDSVPTGRTRSLSEIVGDMAHLLKSILERLDLSHAQVNSIGVGYPGIPTMDGDGILYCNNIDAFHNVSFKKVLGEHFPDIPIFLENDANAAAFGEMACGAAKGEKDVIMVTLGTGVGGGIIIDGKLYSGFNNAGGELGHITIDRNGILCNCGRRGCWESYASVTALVQQTEEKMKQHPESKMHELAEKNNGKINGRIAFDAMRQGDIAAKEVVDTYIEYVGIGIADMINIFTPKKLVVGGGISNEGETLLAPLRDYVYKHIYTKNAGNVPTTEIVKAELGNDAGIIGAALLYQQYRI